jgi:hypothetical protein
MTRLTVTSLPTKGPACPTTVQHGPWLAALRYFRNVRQRMARGLEIGSCVDFPDMATFCAFVEDSLPFVGTSHLPHAE